MINETINQLVNSEISYSSWTQITTSTPFIIISISIWLGIILLLVIIGAISPAKTSSGLKLEKRAIQTPNYWISLIVLFFVYPIFYITLIIYPIWIFVLK